MAGENGRLLKILVNTGTVASPSWTLLASSRNHSVTSSTTFIDLSNKDSLDEAGTPGRRSVEISVDALYTHDAAVRAILAYKQENNETVQIQLQNNSTSYKQATFVITSTVDTFPDDAESTISISLKRTGEWTIL